MQIEERDDIAKALLQQVFDRLQSQHKSGGTAVASVKELTQCLLAAWGERHLGWKKPPIRDDVDALNKILAGVAFGDLLNPDVEERIEIQTKAGIISGRIDLADRVTGNMEMPDGSIMEFGGIIPGEIKLTWKSPRKTMYDFTQYLHQLLRLHGSKNSQSWKIVRFSYN